MALSLKYFVTVRFLINYLMSRKSQARSLVDVCPGFVEDHSRIMWACPIWRVAEIRSVIMKTGERDKSGVGVLSDCSFEKGFECGVPATVCLQNYG